MKYFKIDKIGFILLLGIAFIGCSKENPLTPQAQTASSPPQSQGETGPINIETLQIPQGFDFSTTQNIEVNITVLDHAGNPVPSIRLDISKQELNQSLTVFSGATNSKGILSTYLTLPAYLTDLNVEVQSAAFPQRAQVSIQQGKANHTFSASQTSAPVATKASLLQLGSGPLVESLRAGQHIDIGNVTISDDGVMLYVTYNVLASGWGLETTHVNVSADAIVVEGNTIAPSDGRPAPGKYTVQANHSSNTTTYTYAFALASLQGNQIYVLTHAATNQGETAYGGSQENTGRGWWYYSIYTPGSGSAPTDTDGDGIVDSSDDFPTDPTKAFTSYSPGQNQFGTLAFEDLWPNKGDFDFNDMVVNYNFTNIYNANNQLVEIISAFKVKAFGAAYRNGFGFELPFDPSYVAQVDGQQISHYYIQRNNNGTEAGQTKATIIVFDDAYELMPPPQGYFVNTETEAPYIDPISITVTTTLQTPWDGTINPTNSNWAPYNPFIISNGERDREVHLPGYMPTDLVDQGKFGSGDDSSLNTGYYRTINSLPWALHLTSEWQHPRERIDIVNAYYNFASWAESGGLVNNDWYIQNNSNSNTQFIYPR